MELSSEVIATDLVSGGYPSADSAASGNFRIGPVLGGAEADTRQGGRCWLDRSVLVLGQEFYDGGFERRVADGLHVLATNNVKMDCAGDEGC